MILLPNACWLGHVWSIGERYPGVARTKSCPPGRTKSPPLAGTKSDLWSDGGADITRATSAAMPSCIWKYEVKEVRAQRCCAGSLLNKSAPFRGLREFRLRRENFHLRWREFLLRRENFAGCAREIKLTKEKHYTPHQWPRPAGSSPPAPGGYQ